MTQCMLWEFTPFIGFSIYRLFLRAAVSYENTPSLSELYRKLPYENTPPLLWIYHYKGCSWELLYPRWDSIPYENTPPGLQLYSYPNKIQLIFYAGKHKHFSLLFTCIFLNRNIYIFFLFFLSLHFSEKYLLVCIFLYFHN